MEHHSLPNKFCIRTYFWHTPRTYVNPASKW